MLKDIGIKTPGRYQLDFFILNESYRSCLQQYGLWLEDNNQSLGKSLGRLEIPESPNWSQLD